VLLVVAALTVAGAVLSGSWLLVTVTAALAVALGASATRITYSELLQTRHEAARDRARQARDYRALTEARVAEHAEFAAAVQARADRQETALGELEVALASAQKRAAAATRRLNAEARRAEVAEQEGRAYAVRLEEAEERAAEAIVRVAELEQEADVLRAEIESWRSQPYRQHA
jgi:chromosome segregation ATPase